MCDCAYWFFPKSDYCHGGMAPNQCSPKLLLAAECSSCPPKYLSGNAQLSRHRPPFPAPIGPFCWWWGWLISAYLTPTLLTDMEGLVICGRGMLSQEKWKPGMRKLSERSRSASRYRKDELFRQMDISAFTDGLSSFLNSSADFDWQISYELVSIDLLLTNTLIYFID